MEFASKMAIVVEEDLEIWQKLNVVAFLTSGIIGETDGIIGEEYVDASGQRYSPLCIQPAVILKAPRQRLLTFLKRANNRGVRAAVYIEDMFSTGHDAANRSTVAQYETESLPLVGIGVRSEKKQIDKVLKGAKLHN